jgi:hypothetical protein
MFKPLSLRNTQAVFGKASALGIWIATVCSATPVMLFREEIMMAAPDLHDVPNTLAIDELNRQAARDPRSLIGNNGDAALGLASTAATAIGLAANSSAGPYVGLGLSLFQFIFQHFKRVAPNPQPYLKNLLADRIVIDDPRGCQWGYVVASLMHNARTIGPVAIPAMPKGQQP